ncbi:hypothetical protein [Pseudomonas protegens]|uniref:hypothetical protein n=1 Tax=Pseudomonas protegens TaxID=380021 RepID=UPI001E29EAA9|nr:hypothetical protein [Pseudomonas protegens]MCD9571763.1 hypothetical protein [Pseudomonas protegens]
MNLFFTLATLALAVFSLVSVVIYLSRRAKYRMNLHGKAHRSITEAELAIAKKFAVVIGLNGHRLAQ